MSSYLSAAFARENLVSVQGTVEVFVDDGGHGGQLSQWPEM